MQCYVIKKKFVREHTINDINWCFNNSLLALFSIYLAIGNLTSRPNRILNSQASNRKFIMQPKKKERKTVF